MRSCVAILFSLITVLLGHIAPAAGNDLGVVLLHGKGGLPSGYIRELAAALESKGYLVSTPTMPWAQNRIYDASFEEAMSEIDREVASLRQKGAKFVVIAGHSLGANAALGYVASRDRVEGIIALAPAHTPELQGFRKRVGPDVSRARALITAGKGKEKQRFSDVNQGRDEQVTATAEVYLSWFDPDGPAVIPNPRPRSKLLLHCCSSSGVASAMRRGRITFLTRHHPTPKADLSPWPRTTSRCRVQPLRRS